MSSIPKELPSHINYLCIEGVIGVGKTTLSNIIAQRFNTRTLVELADDNPFLSEFYNDRKSYAFQTQVWFLLSRYKQLAEKSFQQNLFQSAIVSDYMFAKDRIFASLNLDENELSLYNNIANILEANVLKPDFVVYLQASTDVLLRRISKRGRSYEFNMDASYIDALNQAYNHFFFHYTDSPLLIVNCNDVDFVKNSLDLEDIIKEIFNTTSGTNYYHPMGSNRKNIKDEQKESLL